MEIQLYAQINEGKSIFQTVYVLQPFQDFGLKTGKMPWKTSVFFPK